MNAKHIALLASFFATPAFAQATAPVQTAIPVSPAPAPVAVAVLEAPATQNVLRAGTEVPMITREELTTKKKQLRIGQRVQLETSANVEMNGVVVIPVGTPGVAEITEVRNKGMWGKSGYINARVLSIRLGDRNIRLSGTFDDKGVTGTAGVVASVALVPLVGFFTTGTSANIPSGSGLKGFLDEDIVFRTVSVAAPVVEVPVAAPVAMPVASPTAAPVAAPVVVPAANPAPVKP